MNIIDRRRDPGGKSLANRQRFIRRARALVRRAVREASAKRSIKDVEKGGDIVVPADGVREPTLRRGSVGRHARIRAAGQQEVRRGRHHRAAEDEDGGGGASADGEGEDDFRFALSDEEFLDLFLEDLELPDLAKRQVMGVEETPAGAGRLSLVRAAGDAVGRADDAQLAVAPHRARTAQARGRRGAGGRDRKARRRGRP